MTDSTIAIEADVEATGVRADAPRITVSVTSRIEEVSGTWAVLAARGPVESPGQTVGFTQLWADSLKVPERDRLFVVASLDGAPVALLPLMRRQRFGLRLLTWFPGRHVGCNAPVVDVGRLQAMTTQQRLTLWRTMLAATGADLAYLPAVPQLAYFNELGASTIGDTLYRAEFASWEEADKTQRSKSRRKHDRQQGERLDALGKVSFEELDGGAENLPVLDLMFRQRAARFSAMGIADPFADPRVRAFYDATLLRGSGVPVKLHVLRLDGEIVAVRYNVVSGNRMFCLISSMSDDPRIQGGSPGKQCLLRVMQTVFGEGFRSFDMGAGFTDEKRHWCNVTFPVRQHYVPLTPLGHVAAASHRIAQHTRHDIKTNPRLLALAKKARALMNRGKTAAQEEAAD